MGANGRPEDPFEYELEVFRKEADEAVQHLYAYLTMHAVAGDQNTVRQLYNANPLFWLTALRALQTSVFIVLGRIFSQDSEHNLDALLRIAEEDQAIFSRDSLARRKSEIAGLDVNEYVRDAFVPTAMDFRSLRREVREWRRIYETNYRAVRNQIFAHAEVSEPEDVGALFARTNVQELEILVTDLVGLHSRLQNLLQNGNAPTLVRGNSSVQAIRTMAAEVRHTLHGRVTTDTERALLAAAETANRERR
jgi:hypothetical protein